MSDILKPNNFDAPLEEVSPEDQLAAMVRPASGNVSALNVTPEVAPIARYFNVTNADSKDITAMQDIASLFPDATGPGDLLACIRKLQREMAQPNIGESPLHYLANYVRVLKGVQDAQAEADAYRK